MGSTSSSKGNWRFSAPGITSVSRRSIWFKKRQDFSHREADGKSLLDEVLCRERGERPGAGWKDEWVGVGWWEWWGNLRRRFFSRRAVFLKPHSRLFENAVGEGAFSNLVHLPERLRHAEFGPLGEKRCARAAAMGTTRRVRMAVVERWFAEFRKFVQCFD